MKLDASTVEIEERGVKLRLTVVDTPGFGDAIDNTDSFEQIIRYIDEQFERSVAFVLDQCKNVWRMLYFDIFDIVIRSEIS